MYAFGSKCKATFEDTLVKALETAGKNDENLKGTPALNLYTVRGREMTVRSEVNDCITAFALWVAEQAVAVIDDPVLQAATTTITTAHRSYLLKEMPTEEYLAACRAFQQVRIASSNRNFPFPDEHKYVWYDAYDVLEEVFNYGYPDAVVVQGQWAVRFAILHLGEEAEAKLCQILEIER